MTDANDFNNLDTEINRLELNNLETNDEHVSVNHQLNILVVGETGAGKGSFINAFRDLENNNEDKNHAKVGSDTLPTMIDKNQQVFDYTLNDMTIYFFDTNGFLDNNDSKLEPQIDALKKQYELVEFQAILFLIKDKISTVVIDYAKKMESSMSILYFVYNKMDDNLRHYLKHKNKIHRNLIEKENFEKYGLDLKEQCKQIKLQIIKDHIIKNDVFNSLSNDFKNFKFQKFSSEYFERFLYQSVYLISSSKDIFENEICSPDGKRIRHELTQVLTNVRVKNIDILDENSKRFIFLKKKIISKELFGPIKKKLSLLGGSVTSIIPFLDSIPNHFIYKNYKSHFMEMFGIKVIFNMIECIEEKKTLDEANKKYENLIKQNLKKLQEIKASIKSDKVIESVDEIMNTFKTTNGENFKQNFKNILDLLLKSLGITMVALADDIVAFFGKYAGSIINQVVSGISKGVTVALSLLTIPVSMVLYVYLTRRAIEAILSRYEEYALILSETIYPLE